MTPRQLALVSLLAACTPASRRPEHPVQLEVGVNTRHYAAAHAAQDVAFRTSGEPDASLDAGTALSTSLRFTGRGGYNSFIGVEGEAGKMLGFEHSNLAGAYGVAGLRGELGRVRVGAELVAGRRWVRYEVVGKEDHNVMIAEPRVRGDIWLAPQLTVGGAFGATLGDRSVWMAGIYLGIHSLGFDRN